MSDFQRLPVTHPTGQYDVIIGTNLLPDIRKLANIEGPIALITDGNVGPIYAEQIEDAACVVTLPAGEEFKTLASINHVYDEMLAAGLDRTCTVVALGGG